MSALSEFGDICKQTIVWEPATGRDEYGKPTYGSPQTFVGRRVLRRSRVPGRNAPNSGGVIDAVAESTIWILATPNIKYEDRVYVQGDTVFPPVVNIQIYPDETGQPYYVKVIMGASG